MRTAHSVRSGLALHRRAFTLTELAVVIAIVGILATLGFYFFSATRHFTDELEGEVAAAQARNADPWATGKRVIKKSPKHAASPVLSPPSTPIPGNYLVLFKDSVTNVQAEATRLAHSFSGQVLAVYIDVFKGCALEIADKDAPALAQDSAVQEVEQDYEFSAAAATVPTGVHRIESLLTLPASNLTITLPKILERQRNLHINTTQTSASIVVAILDSGVDANHPELNVPVEVTFGALNPGDFLGHGTHLAGIIGAKGVNIVGVSPGTPIWSLKILNKNGVGKRANLLSALNYVARHSSQIRVALIGQNSAAASKMVDQAVNKVVSDGVFVVVAAGNDATLVSALSPARAARALTIAALADSDGKPGGLGPATPDGPDDTFATFSNYGPEVAYLAPGVDIYSTLPSKSYGSQSGTSQAAAHFAGLLALLLDPTTSVGTAHRNLTIGAPHATFAEVNLLLPKLVSETYPGIYDSRSYPFINLHLP